MIMIRRNSPYFVVQVLAATRVQLLGFAQFECRVGSLKHNLNRYSSKHSLKLNVSM